ncbi:MAG TPA: 2OG-Fe(II) oxygenase [Roseivirga sp.]
MKHFQGKPFDLERVRKSADVFKGAKPFPHITINNFLNDGLARDLAKEFPLLNDPKLFVYENALEHKNALNDWNAYPPATYQLLQFLNSKEVVDTFSELVDIQLYADNGLHGGGWHMHASGGKLNPHLDYSIHPKLGLQRKLNLIIYLSEAWKSEWGGSLGLWSNDQENNQPKELVKEVEIEFNKALLFDTTCNSWHGISRPVNCPKGMSRNSIAVYYLSEPSLDAPTRSRALYAPTESQKNDQAVLDLIKKRADLAASKDVYKNNN